MNVFVSSVLLLLVVGSVSAKPFTVGETILDIPPPEGFSLVTPKMEAVYRLSLQAVDPLNEQLAYYIPELDVPLAMSGEIPSVAYYFIVKVHKKIKDAMVSEKDFAELKSLTVRENEKVWKLMEPQMREFVDDASRNISKEFNIDFELKLYNIIPFHPHFETENALAYSMIINYGAEGEGFTEDSAISATATFANVAGKVLFLYCYAPQDELEWTRRASRSWAEQIMESNSRPPSRSSLGAFGFDWGEATKKAIIGGIIGGFIGLMISVYSKLKKKS